jgi:predicted DNA-binding protein YlxM (UPF0122 family)
MEERVEISLLLDLYSPLLTDKQRDIMTMYYNEDFSLSEIAELNATSRQAIHDVIRRCQKLLLDYEKKLELKQKNDILANSKKLILEKINNLKLKTDYNEITICIIDIEKYIIENL